MEACLSMKEVGFRIIEFLEEKMNNCNNNRVFIVSKEKSKQFLEDRKNNVISPEFLKRCLYAHKMLNKGRE